MATGSNLGLVMALLAGGAVAAAQPAVKHEESLEEARRAYEASDYGKAIEVLEEASAREPKNGDIQLLLAKSYLELQQHDAAIRSAEKAVALEDRKSTRLNSSHGYISYAVFCLKKKKIAVKLFLVSGYLVIIGLVKIVSPDTVPLSSDDPLMHGLEISAPNMFLIPAGDVALTAF